MNSAYDLPAEDLPEFERVLEEALRAFRLATGADPYRIVELRAAALHSVSGIAAAAAAEHHRFDRLRRHLRDPAAPASHGGPGTRGEVAPGSRTHPAGTGEERSGAGALAAVAALVPVLAVIAAVIFLGLGYGLGLADPEPAIAASMREAGWIFAAFAGLGVLLGVGALVVAAARNGSATSVRASRAAGRRAGDLARAREEWHRALLDHGVMPFLRAHATAAESGDGDGDGDGGVDRDGDQTRRTPRLRFASPDFSSPDFSSRAGAEGRDTTRGRPGYSHPGFSGPDYTRPRFTSPAEGRGEPVTSAERAAGRPEAGPEPRSAGLPSPEIHSREIYSPDFDSPDFDSPGALGGLDEDEPRTRPGFAPPDFTSPEFTSPAEGGTERDTRG